MALRVKNERELRQLFPALPACIPGFKEMPAKTGRPKPATDERGMNGLEGAYCLVLEAEKVQGLILDWKFGAVRLRLAGRTFYTPDFTVWMPDGRVEIRECKGFMRDDAAVKLKMAAAIYPHWAFRLVTRKGKTWIVRPVTARGGIGGRSDPVP